MEFLNDRALFPEPVYVFRHALTHDVAYGTLLHESRQQLHARVLAALEQGGRDDRAGLPEQRAHHAFAGGVWDRAVQYGREAAARTGLGGREAIGFLENALVALARLPDGPRERELAVDLRHQMCALLIPQGEHRRMLALLREAETLATGLGDDARLVRTLALLCTGHWEVGNTPEALATGVRAVSMAEGLGNPGLELSAKLSLGGAVRAIGRYRQAAELFRSCLGLSETPPPLGGPPGGVGAVRARAHLAWSLAELGEFPGAIRVAEEGIRLAQAAEHPYGLALAHLGLGGTFIRQGRMAEASAVLERGLALTRDAPFLHPPMAADLAVTYALAGRHDAGIELGEQAVRRAEEMGRLGRLSLIVTHLGEVYFLAGRRQDALAQAERALRLASERMERGNEVYARRLLGLVAAESEPADVLEAHAQLGQALALAETLGMRPLLARCHLVLGRLARRHADVERAARHLDSATRLLRAMDMEFWLSRLALDRIGGAGGAD
jgi:tetratricopeptide (TPR) repeat protein